jgi:hypothetical protein
VTAGGNIGKRSGSWMKLGVDPNVFGEKRGIQGEECGIQGFN